MAASTGAISSANDARCPFAGREELFRVRMHVAEPGFPRKLRVSTRWPPMKKLMIEVWANGPTTPQDSIGLTAKLVKDHIANDPRLEHLDRSVEEPRTPQSPECGFSFSPCSDSLC
jgi:hypothetical protein